MSGSEIYTESWFDSNKQRAVTHALESVSGHGKFVEIGSFEGKSTVFIANKIYPEKLHAVDTWAGGESAPYEKMKYATTPIENHFDHNIAVATQGNVIKNKMGWELFFAIMESIDIAFIYVDGPHDYPSVTETLKVVSPMIVKGGVMCGDDYDDVSVKAAVNDYFGDRVEDHGSTWIVKF
jgi:hypothetical protein